VRKLIIVGILLVVVGAGGLVVAHRYRPIPAGYFLSGVPGAPTRLSPTNHSLVVGCADAAILAGVATFVFATERLIRSKRHKSTTQPCRARPDRHFKRAPQQHTGHGPAQGES
jgi:hypothetical protein